MISLSPTSEPQASAIFAIHRFNLKRVILENAFPCTTRLAEKWLGRVERALKHPQDFVGWFGPDEVYGAAINDIVREADWHKANPAVRKSEAA